MKNLIFVENVEVDQTIATIKPAIKARSKRGSQEVESFSVNFCPISDPVVKIVRSMYVLRCVNWSALNCRSRWFGNLGEDV